MSCFGEIVNTDILDHPIVQRAVAFASGAHYGVGQVRKYTGEAYINHPIAVAEMVASTKGCSPDSVAAAYLHDTVEDTKVTLEDIERVFNRTIAEYVGYLTETSKEDRPDLNRRSRKELDAHRLALAPPEVQTIKYADFIDNTSSILKRDPKFAEVYLPEKAMMLQIIDKGDVVLYSRAVENTRLK